MSKREIRLPEDVYETLHFAALAFGGIGASQDFEVSGCPLCIHGMARASHPRSQHDDGWNLSSGLVNLGISRRMNDDAVVDINLRKKCDAWQRVTWEEWCAELNVVPAVAPTTENQ